MQTFQVGQPDDQPEELTRRKLLSTLAFSLPAAWLLGSAIVDPKRAYAQVESNATAARGFMDVSRLLTGHPEILDDLADPAWSALVQRNPNFETAFKALQGAISSSGLTRFEDYPRSSIAVDPALKTTAVAIVSAWYLGRVGKVNNMGETDSTMVTFTHALMWAPTIDITVLPTYARAGPGHWAAPPAGVTPR